MTQHPMFGAGPKITGMRLDVEDLTLTEMTDGIVLSVRQRYSDGMEATVWSGRWSGVMVDYLDTFVRDTTAAFLYGKPGDVARAAAGVHLQAKRHKASHDRSGA